ncbi:MAG: hypothetical protein HKN43_02390 [Rhodothermales bacterium]|nr:hypothetical protein [Rhodothermales bacterium]
MGVDLTSTTALWWAVVVSGLYHGVNPGMGWPLAVSAGLMQNRTSALPEALGMLAFGHLLAMLVILMPFSIMAALFTWEREIRLGAGLLVVAMGCYLLINRRHPKLLARIHPARLALWSFLAAMAHGAGLMLLPIYLQLCSPQTLDSGHQAASTLMSGNLSQAIKVAVVHTLSMTLGGGVIAAVIYFYLGLKYLSRTWFNLDILWALSLVIVGVFGVYLAY